MASDGAFDPIEFINKTYSEASLFEINDGLAALAESLSKTQQERKEMITAHFSKFIECRTVLGSIRADMKEKGLDKLDTSGVEKALGLLTQKCKEVTAGLTSEFEYQKQHSRYLYYRNEFASIFELKNSLRDSLNSHINFAKIYGEARKALERVKDSVYMQQKFEEVQPEVREFFKSVYAIISDDSTSFEDACYYFNLYFQVSGGSVGPDDFKVKGELDAKNEYDAKIMMTLLVNFKETATKKRAATQDYVSYLLVSLAQLLKILDREAGREGVVHFFQCLGHLLDAMSPPFAKLVLRRLDEFENALDASAATERYYSNLLRSYKKDVFRVLIKKADVDHAIEIFTDFASDLKERERLDYQNILADVTIENMGAQRMGVYECLRRDADELHRLRSHLGPRSAEPHRRLLSCIKEHRHAAVAEVAGAFIKIIETGDSVHALMEAAKIIHRTPKFGAAIIFEAKNKILENPVLGFYLCRFARLEPPVLSSVEHQEVEELKHQFGFFLSKAL